MEPNSINPNPINPNPTNLDQFKAFIEAIRTDINNKRESFIKNDNEKFYVVYSLPNLPNCINTEPIQQESPHWLEKVIAEKEKKDNGELAWKEPYDIFNINNESISAIVILNIWSLYPKQILYKKNEKIYTILGGKNYRKNITSNFFDFIGSIAECVRFDVFNDVIKWNDLLNKGNIPSVINDIFTNNESPFDGLHKSWQKNAREEYKKIKHWSAILKNLNFNKKQNKKIIEQVTAEANENEEKEIDVNKNGKGKTIKMGCSITLPWSEKKLASDNIIDGTNIDFCKAE